ncbi:MAG: fimbrillin family protein [Bacteroidales bacterium]|nr:fimbrillin family protein [Bacteroidales bacterium]
MNKITHLKHSIIALLGIALLSISCSRDGGLDVLENREVSFSVNSEAISTKVTPTTTSTITASPFGVIAYTHATGAAASAWTLHANSTVTYTSGAWIPSPRVYWPASGSNKVSYFAYWPKADGNGITVTPASNAAPTATVKIKGGSGTELNNQVDFLVAKATDLDDNPAFNALNVNLSFNHVLSGVRFKCEDGVTVESVTISGVYNSGTYDLTTNSWSGQAVSGSDNSYTLTGITYDAASGGYKTFKSEHTLFMLPQQIPAGAKITVKLAGKPDVMVAEMVGHTWDAGKLITYIIKDTLIGILLDVEITDLNLYPETIVFGDGDIEIKPINEENDDGGPLY